MKKSFFFFAISFIALFSGCKKDEEVCNLNAANIVGNYVLTSVKINGAEVFNDPTYFEACERDDIYTIASSGICSISDGPVVCSGSSVDNGTWTLSGDNLTFNGESGIISDFTCSGFNWTITETGFTTVFRFAKQ